MQPCYPTTSTIHNDFERADVMSHPALSKEKKKDKEKERKKKKKLKFVMQQESY